MKIFLLLYDLFVMFIQMESTALVQNTLFLMAIIYVSVISTWSELALSSTKRPRPC